MAWVSPALVKLVNLPKMQDNEAQWSSGLNEVAAGRQFWSSALGCFGDLPASQLVQP